MDHPIKRDHSRFKRIVKGKIRQGLKNYISGRDIIIPKGNGKFKVPIPQIDLPRFKFGDKSQGGTGQGEGQAGDPIKGQRQPREEPGGRAIKQDNRKEKKS